MCAHLVCSVLVIASRRTAQRHVNVACLIAHSSICANVLSEKAPLTLRPSLFAFAFRRRSASFNLDPQVVSLRLWHHTLHVSTRWQGSLVLPPCPAHSLLACRYGSKPQTRARCHPLPLGNEQYIAATAL